MASSSSMPPEVAQRLFVEGAFLILLDVPKGTEIGVDYSCWSVGPKFKGIKMIPPGFHFLYWSAVSKENVAAPRTGSFHFFHKKEVTVKRWDCKIEDLTDEGVSEDMVDRIRMNLQAMDQFLGPYPYKALKKWVSLTNHIAEPLVERVQPLCGNVYSVAQFNSHYTPRPLEENEPVCSKPVIAMETQVATDTDLNEVSADVLRSSSTTTEPEAIALTSPSATTTPETGGFFAGVGHFPPHRPTTRNKAEASQPFVNMTSDQQTCLRFSSIPSQKHPQGATPSQVTMHNMDLSFTLDTMISRVYEDREMEVLGELQLAFISFVVGQVYDGFEQWKKLVHLLCFSESALSRRKDLFISFVTILHFQLKEIPNDFFVDIVSHNNFLTATLQVFFSNLAESSSADPTLVRRGLQFRDNLTKRYKWDFTTEPDEDAPTVVDLDS